MRVSSPFSDNRFEHEIKHLYVVQLELYPALEAAKPTILVGSRGTGKTTLLRSLSWRERTSNVSLQQQLGIARSQDFVGIYIKIPEAHVVGFVQWLSTGPRHIASAIYSRYLELLVIQELLESVSGLMAGERIRLDAKDERHIVLEYVRMEPEAFKFGAELAGEPRTVEELRHRVRMIRRGIEAAAQAGADTQGVVQFIGNPGRFFELVPRLCDLLAGRTRWKSNSRPLRFKICLDEAEALDALGVKILMTWLRICKQPLSIVASFVSLPPDWSETLLENLTIQSADAQRISLDEVKDADFERFADGVADVRIKEFVRREVFGPPGKGIPADFTYSSESQFGKLNLNRLLEMMVRESVSPIAKEVLGLASAMQEQSGRPIQGRGDDSVLPIYEAYLKLRSVRDVRRPTRGLRSRTKSVAELTGLRWAKRNQTSQHERKKMVAAYISLSRELGAELKYAYKDMILQLSDSCIRDYLSNIDSIYRAANQNVCDFILNTPTRPTVQNQGLKSASDLKRNALPSLGVNRPADVAKIVEGLGRLTRRLQSESIGNAKHLATSERGLFVMDLTTGDRSRVEDAVDLIVDAAEAGFLKIERQDPFQVSFRVHTSLAVYFQFSYRGAYYQTPIGVESVLALRDAEGNVAIDQIVRRLQRQIDKAEGDDLFGSLLHSPAERAE